MERCRVVSGVGDLHHVCVHVTGNDIAKVQDVFRQLSSERRSKDTLQIPARLHFHEGGKQREWIIL